MEDSKKNKKISKIIIIVLFVLMLIFIFISVWALFFRESDKTIVPDYPLPEIDSNAEELTGDDSEKMSSSEGGGAISISYSKNVRVNLTKKTMSLYVGNPEKSNQDMVVQVVIDDNVIAQSGRITPGHLIQQLELKEAKETFLSEGGYDGKIVVLYYNQTTGEKAMLNTEIPVTVNVTK